jgi:hypothetical protein
MNRANKTNSDLCKYSGLTPLGLGGAAVLVGGVAAGPAGAAAGGLILVAP